MRILHLSDLHLTDKEFASLAAAFGGIPLFKPERGFDYIVVRGDLSQRAGADEYQQLLDCSHTPPSSHMQNALEW